MIKKRPLVSAPAESGINGATAKIIIIKRNNSE